MSDRPTFDADDALTTRLAALAHPAPPPDLTGIVMARIERVAAARVEPRERSAARGWTAAAAAVGLAAGLALVVSGYGVAVNVLSPIHAGLKEGQISMPATLSSAVVLTAGVVLYAAGLFSSLSGRARA